MLYKLLNILAIKHTSIFERNIFSFEAMVGVQVGDLLREILDMGQLMKKKKDAGGQQVSCQQLLTTLVEKLKKAAPLKVADATKIHGVVEKAAFADNEQKIIMDAVDAAVLAELQQITAEQSALRPQTLTALGKYLTEEDWKILKSSDASYAAKTRTLASRLRKLGTKSGGADCALQCSSVAYSPAKAAELRGHPQDGFGFQGSFSKHS